MTGHDAAPRRRWPRRLVIAVVLVLVLPVPWLHVIGDDPVSHAWKLDGRLFVDGTAVDPGGRWSWLAIGRPPLVAELLRDQVLGNDQPPTDMRTGPMVQAPSLSEPAAAAVGLRYAGRDVPMRLMVEVREPRLPGIPEYAVVTQIRGIEVTDRAGWDAYLGTTVPSAARELPSIGTPSTGTPGGAARPGDDVPSPQAAPGPTLPHPPGAATDEPETIRFTTRQGETFEVPGTELPYDRVHVLDLAPVGLEAGILPPWARLGPVRWFRSLSLGSSHGMMVALMTYADAAGHDLAQTRHVAGTGGIRGDGTVTRIGGLEAKARAARRQGADVLLFPASQIEDLAGFDPRGMQLVPISTLDDAIAALDRPVA